MRDLPRASGSANQPYGYISSSSSQSTLCVFPISPLQASARLHDLLYLEQKDSLCNGCGFMKFPIPHISNISCLPYHKSFVEYSKVLSHLLHMSFNNPKPLQWDAMRVHGSLHKSIIFSIVWVEYVSATSKFCHARYRRFCCTIKDVHTSMVSSHFAHGSGYLPTCEC